MAFDSSSFLIFFAIFLNVYYLLSNHRNWQNFLILISSFFFYGYWNWRFLGLILLSGFIDFFAAQFIVKSKKSHRKWLLTFSITANLIILGFFKYFNFFIDSLRALSETYNFIFDFNSLDIILPIGISFYTFQSISYTVDVYRQRILPERNPLVFFSYISFFPQLVAGPIERAGKLIPQLNQLRSLNLKDIKRAIWLLAWGFFLKVCIADKLVPIVERAFVNGQTDGILVILGLLAFTFQIYCDFNGYSLIAMGLAKLLGFNLSLNFHLPFFTTSLINFWHSWHITLGNWLRDYLFFPILGRGRSLFRRFFALIVTMLLGGLWHGAGHNFIFWGGANGIMLALSHWLKPKRQIKNLFLIFLGWLFTFCTFAFTLLFFRSESLSMINDLMRALLNLEWQASHWEYLKLMTILISPLLLIESWQHYRKDIYLDRLPKGIYRPALAFCILMVFFLFQDADVRFIYFQF